MAITAAVAIILLVVYLVFIDLFGLNGTFFDIEPAGHSSPLSRKGRQLLVAITYITGVWYAVKYIILNKAKASKENGRSEIYDFEPSQRDKIVTWVFFITSCSLIFIVVGIRFLLKHCD